MILMAINILNSQFRSALKCTKYFIWVCIKFEMCKGVHRFIKCGRELYY